MPKAMTTAMLTAVALVVGAAGCGSTDPVDPADEPGMTLRLNGELWASTGPALAPLSVVGLSVFAERWLDGRYPLYRGVGFRVPASAWAGAGRYPLESGADEGRRTAYFVESDGDVSIALYWAVPEAGGWVEVTRYDETTGALEGRFEGVFAVQPDHAASPRRELPDTLRVTEGRFRAVVDDRR